MESLGEITVKAFLEKPGQNQAEIRRFTLAEGASTNFEYLRSKLSNLYPSLSDTSYQLCWKDDEGDMVAIGSDEELIQALLYGRPDGLLKLYLRVTNTNSGFSCGNASEPTAEHPNVVCDGCQGPVRGIRFKCMVCPDFDLCGMCCDKGFHNEHYMLRMSKPASDWTGPCGGMGRPGGNRSGAGWWPGYAAFGGRQGAWNPRRFWKQFMRGQQQNADCSGSAPGCGSTGPCEDGAAPPNPPQADGSTPPETSTEREFLEHVGHQVSALLEPLGIEVDVEERKTPRAHAAGGFRGRRHGKCKPDPQCQKRCAEKAATNCAYESTGNGKCKPDPQCQKRCAEKGATNCAYKTTEMPPTSAGQAEPDVTAKEGQTQEGGSAAAPVAAPDAAAEEKKSGETDMDSDESSWIKVEPKPEDMDVIVLEQPPSEAGPSAPPATDSSSQATGVPLTRLYPSLVSSPAARPKTSPPSASSEPSAAVQHNTTDASARKEPITDLDEKVMQAVNQMKAMGFHDEGGWMTAMLYQNNGEIYRVIDTVLKAAHKKN